MNKPLLECTMKKKKNQILKLLKDQKILKNCLEIIETKQNIYNKTIEKYKRKMIYIQKNNFNYCKLFYLIKNS